MTDQIDFRPEARAPRGFQDRRAQDVRAERAILEAVARVYESYGFEPLDTSAFEYADALGKFLPDADRPNEGVFALQDDPDSEGNGQWMALRYDLTAPLARFAAQNWESLPKPFRRYAAGTVWRNEKPGPGRFREFTQCDADTVGSARPEADAEIIAMAVAGLEAAGLPRGSAVVKINNRKLLNGLLAAAGAVDQGQKLGVLRAVDKLDRLGPDGVRLLLGEGRKDESGAFTKGAGLNARAVEAVLAFVQAGGGDPAGVLDRIAAVIGGSAEGDEGLAELARIGDALKGLGVAADQAFVDPSVVRGLEYYTGPVFEAELLLQTTDERGEAVRFGSIGGGGRYDDLVARFTGQPVPATGFSFGVSRLAAALRAAGRDAGKAQRGPVVVIAFSPDHMADYFAVAGELRAAGVAAEVYLGGSGMKAQMKYADRRLSPAAVIIGDDERAAGTVTVKDLDLGRVLASQLTGNDAWRAERPGQATIPRGELTAFVRRILEFRDVSLLAETPPPAEVLAAVRAPFAAFGGVWVDAPVLQPLTLLLDLAGEAMRPRLFVVQAEGGEAAALRPDFTIPVARAHIAGGTSEGRYLYEGQVFRVAPADSGRPAEYLQIGAERFGPSDDAPAEDAEMAALAWAAAKAGGRKDLSMALGDVGLFHAFVQALGLPEGVRTRLGRAFASGRGLAAELERAQADAPAESNRGRLSRLLTDLPEAEAAAVLEELWRLAGIQPVGGRGPAEIVHRLAERAETARGARLSPAEAGLIRRYLEITADPRAALDGVEKLAYEARADLEAPLAAWIARLKALVAAGVPETALTLSTGLVRPFGYYDGMLFEVRSAALGPDRLVAAGGRYDGLPARLGGPETARAVGCIVRPGRAWKEGAA